MKHPLSRIPVVLCLCVLALLAARAQGPSGYHLINEIAVGGEGGWDGLIADPDNHRLYVSHATKAIVIDTASDKVVGEITGTNGIHCIAFADKFNKGFTTDGRDNKVTIFDLKTLKILGTIPTGKNPDAITYDPATKRIFAFNGASNDVTVIDAAENKVVGTLGVGGKPEFAASDGKGTVYVNLEDKSEIAVIDAEKLTIKAHWPLAPGEEPTGLAIDAKNGRLFAACNKRLVVVDSASGRVLADLPTGQGTDGAEFDPSLKYAFAPNGGDATLTVVREESKDKFTVLENVPTRRGARTMAIDTKAHKIYLPVAKYGDTPAPTAAQPRPRPSMVPGSFAILVYAK